MALAEREPLTASNAHHRANAPPPYGTVGAAEWQQRYVSTRPKMPSEYTEANYFRLTTCFAELKRRAVRKEVDLAKLKRPRATCREDELSGLRPPQRTAPTLSCDASTEQSLIGPLAPRALLHGLHALLADGGIDAEMVRAYVDVERVADIPAALRHGCPEVEGLDVCTTPRGLPLQQQPQSALSQYITCTSCPPETAKKLRSAVQRRVAERLRIAPRCALALKHERDLKAVPLVESYVCASCTFEAAIRERNCERETTQVHLPKNPKRVAP